MAIKEIKVNKFPESIDPKNWVVVADANGVSYKISKENLKAYLGTVQTNPTRPIKPSDPSPTLDGVYVPTVDGIYANSGGLARLTAEGQADYGMAVEFIKNGATWVKNTYPLQMQDVSKLVAKEDLKIEGLSFSNGTVLFPSFNYFPKDTWTVEMFIKITDASTTQMIFDAGFGNPAMFISTDVIFLGKSGVESQVKIYIEEGWVNKFVFLSTSFDGINYQISVDGIVPVILKEASATYAKTNSELSIGNVSGGTMPFKGSISLFRIFDKEVTINDTIMHYNEGLPSRYYTEKTSALKLELLAENANSKKWLDSSIYSNHSTSVKDVVVSSTMPLSISQGGGSGYLSALPSKVYVAVGRELNIFYKSLIPHYGKEVRINVFCSQGESSERSFRFTPSATGSYSATVQVEDLFGNIIESKTITINAVAKNNGSGTKQILFIGDSTTDSYITDYLGTGREKYEMVKEFYSLVTTDGGIAPLLLGTNGVAPYRHEGRSGYSIDLFTGNNPTYPNPFWDGARVNFKWWMSSNSNFGGSDRIDYIYIQLGINDLKNGENPSIALNRMKTLIGLINNATYGYPNAKIIISQTPYACGDRSGWAEHFMANSDYEKYIHNMVDYATLLIDTFHENATYANVSICPTFLFVDRDYGYPFVLKDASARSDVKIKEFTDSVHPDTSGYNQAADAYYSKLRSLL